MNILVDENIPAVHALFQALGSVRTRPGRAITRDDLANVELLLVRSVTRVDSALLDGTPVRFVATATSGVDHVDQEYLRSRGIAFASAPGSNADAVADYVTIALVTLAARFGESLAGRVLGIIGHGQVGSRVASRTCALGLQVLINDPPLARRTGDAVYRPLDEVLEQAEIVSLHCSLTREGPDASFHLADRAFFDRVRSGCVFLNTSRGEVVEEHALRGALVNGKIRAAALDVWENEPAPDPETIGAAALATPHVAGYSKEGKLRGAQMVYEAACAFLGRSPAANALSAAEPPPVLEPTLPGNGVAREAVLAAILREVYDIEVETTATRRLGNLSEPERSVEFERLRRRHGPRSEFTRQRIEARNLPQNIQEILAGLGFRLV